MRRRHRATHRRQLRSHAAPIATSGVRDRGDRCRHRGNSRVGHGVDIAHELAGEERAAFAVAAVRRELAPRERKLRQRIVRHEGRDTARVAAAIERGVCRDKSWCHARGAESLHRGLPQGCRGQRIARRVKDVGGDLLHEGEGVKARQQRRHEIARAFGVAGVERFLGRDERRAETTQAQLVCDGRRDEHDDRAERHELRGRGGAEGQDDRRDRDQRETEKPPRRDRRMAAGRDRSQHSPFIHSFQVFHAPDSGLSTEIQWLSTPSGRRRPLAVR